MNTLAKLGSMRRISEAISETTEQSTNYSYYYPTGCLRLMGHATPYQAVKEFHEAYGLVVRKPGNPINFTFEDYSSEDVKLFYLRNELNKEEWEELEVAWVGEDLVQYVDAVCDLIYVLAGSLVSFGVDLDACFAEVHRSNMSKLGKDGKPIVREDGKILKGPNFTPPDLRSIIYNTEG
jgi:Phosphoribosyl-ATP pyrophosphohydrolase